MQRKVIGSAQANLPWAILEVEGYNCKLSLGVDENTDEIIELGIEHNDILYAPNLLGQVVSGKERKVRLIVSYDNLSAPISRVPRVNKAVDDLIVFCKECEAEGIFTIVD